MMSEVQVAYDYAAQAEDELTLKVGEIITNVAKVADGWCEGVLNGRKGMFPDNFVRPAPVVQKPHVTAAAAGDKSVAAPRTVLRPNAGVSELRSKLGSIIGGPPPAAARGVKKSTKRARVTNVYTAQHEDELSLEIGTIIDVLKTDGEEGWWEGSINGGRVGMFPNNFVELLTEESDPQGGDAPHAEIKGRKVEGVGFGNIFGGAPIVLRSTKPGEKKDVPAPTGGGGSPSETPRMGGAGADARMSVRLKTTVAAPAAGVKTEFPRAKVLFAYFAENDDELSLAEGQVVTVIDQDLEDKGWWKGDLNGKIGVFPDNFVELIPPVDDKPKKPVFPPSAAKVPAVDVKKKEELPKAKEEPPKAVVPAKSWGITASAVGDKKIAKIPPDAKVSVDVDDQRGKNNASSHEKLNNQPTGPAGGQAKFPAQKPPGRPAVGPTADESRREFPVHTPTSPSSKPMVRSDSKDASAFVGVGVIGAGGGAKGTTVSLEQYGELQREVAQLREAIEQTRKAQDKRFLELMTEIDEEKKTRLSLQVEIDRLKKVLATDK